MRAYLFVGLTIALGCSSPAQTTPTHHRYRHSAHPHHKTRRVSHRRLHLTPASLSCGGTDRWDVKNGSDTGAAAVNRVPVNGISIVDLNNLQPQPIGPDGRMQEERVTYRISGILRLFKHDADGDYHVVVADDGSTPYAVTRQRGGHVVQTAASGHSMVVEVPDPKCVSGKHRQYGASEFESQLQESRADFETATKGLATNRDLGTRNIPVTVAGVLFFDFMHGQTGHGLPHPAADPVDKKPKVVELHPVLCNDVNGYREKAGKPAC